MKSSIVVNHCWYTAPSQPGVGSVSSSRLMRPIRDGVEMAPSSPQKTISRGLSMCRQKSVGDR